MRGMASGDDDIVLDIENFDFENIVVPVSPLRGGNIAFAQREVTSHELRSHFSSFTSIFC